jgi:tetratricopeptide (TPR) repeat protein
MENICSAPQLHEAEAGGQEAYTLEQLSQYCTASDLGLECACSKRQEIKIGTGTTTRKEESTVYYYARQVDDDLLALQTLNEHWLPVGEAREITLAELVTQYQPEVDVFLKKIRPAMVELRKTIARGDRHRRNGQPYSAELEYNRALAMDEDNVRALFGLGLTYLQYGQPEKAQTVFEHLVTLDGFMDPAHKHLFNEFGIALRKQKLYEEAERYYTRALEICPDDENLYFNLGRALYEAGKLEHAANAARICLSLNPAHGEAAKLARAVARAQRAHGTETSEG